MTNREIERGEWREFADNFSRQHGGWLVSLYDEKRDGKRECIARDVPFRGVFAESGDGRDDIVVMVDGTEERHLAHTVNKPIAVALEQTDQGADVALSIKDAAGNALRTEFRTAIPVTMVDGSSADEHHKKQSSLKEWGFDADTFEAKAKQVLQDLKQSRGPIATEIRDGLDRAWKEIEEAFARARKAMNERR